MPSSSRNKHDYFIKVKFSLQKPLFYVKRYGGRGGGAGDHEFWYTSSKVYSDITYYLFLAITSNLRAMS